MKKRMLLGVGLLALAMAGCSEGNTTETTNPEDLNPRVTDISFSSSTLDQEFNVNETKSIISLTLPNEIEEFNFDVFKFKTDIDGKAVTAKFKNEANEEIDYNQKLKRGLTRYYLELKCDDYKEVWTIEVTWNRPNDVSITSVKGDKYFKLNYSTIYLEVNYNLNGEDLFTPIYTGDVIGFDTKTPGKKQLSYNIEGQEFTYDYEVFEEFPEDTYISIISPYYIGNEKRINLEYEANGEIVKRSIPFDMWFEQDLSTNIKESELDNHGSVSLYLLFDDYYWHCYLPVEEPSEKIEIESLKRVYNVDDSFVPGKLNVTINGSTELIDITSDMITGLDLSKEGISNVTISYKDMKIEVSFLVKPRSLGDLVIPEGEKLARDRVVRLIALKNIVFRGSSSDDIEQMIQYEIKNITEAEAKEYELYLMAVGLKASDLEAVISFYTKNYSYLRNFNLALPDTNELFGLYKDLAELLNLFTDDQLAMSMSFKSEVVKYDNSFEVLNPDNPFKPIKLSLHEFLKRIGMEDLEEAFDHEREEPSISLVRDFANIARGLAFLYKDMTIEGNHGYNQAIIIDYLFNDPTNSGIMSSYLDIYFNRQGVDKYNNRYYILYKLFLENGNEITEMFRLFNYYDKELDLLSTVYYDLNTGTNNGYNRLLAVRALETITPIVGPLIENIKSTGNFNTILSFTSKAFILRLIDRAYSLESYDFSLIEDEFTIDYDKNQYINSGNIILVKKGTSYDDFLALMYDKYRANSFVNEDEIKASLSVPGNYYLYIGGNYSNDMYAYMVYDETNFVAYNDEISFNYLKNYVIYEDNDGISGVDRNTIYEYKNRVYYSLENMLNSRSFRFLLDGTTIFERSLSDLKYTISISERSYNGFDLNVLEIITELGSFYFGINYVNAKEPVISDYSLHSLFNNKTYKGILAGDEAEAYIVFNSYYKVSKVDIKTRMYDKHNYGIQEIEIEVDGNTYKIKINVVDRLGDEVKIPRYLQSMSIYPDNIDASIRTLHYNNIVGEIKHVAIDEIKRAYMRSYGYSNVEFKYTIINMSEDNAEYRVEIFGDGEKVFEDITQGEIMSDEAFNAIWVRPESNTSLDREAVLANLDTDEAVIDYVKDIINNTKLEAIACIYGYNGKNLLGDLEYNNIPYDFKIDRHDEFIVVKLFINSVYSNLELTLYDRDINRSQINGLKINPIYGTPQNIFLPVSIDGYTEDFLKLYFMTASIGFSTEVNLYVEGKYFEYKLTMEETEEFFNTNDIHFAVNGENLIVSYNDIEAQFKVVFHSDSNPDYIPVDAIYDEPTYRGLREAIKMLNLGVTEYGNLLTEDSYDSIEVIDKEINGNRIIYTYSIRFNGFTAIRKLDASYGNTFENAYIRPQEEHSFSKNEINDENIKSLLYVRAKDPVDNFYSKFIGVDIDKALAALNETISYTYDEKTEEIKIFIKESNGSIGYTVTKEKEKEPNPFTRFEYFIDGNNAYTTNGIIEYTILDDFKTDDLLSIVLKHAHCIVIGDTYYGKGKYDEDINTIASNPNIVIEEDKENNILRIKSKYKETGIEFKIVNTLTEYVSDIEVMVPVDLPSGLSIDKLADLINLKLSVRYEIFSQYVNNITEKENILKHFSLTETEESYILAPIEGGYYGFNNNIVVPKKIK